jgi:amino acid transporter
VTAVPDASIDRRARRRAGRWLAAALVVFAGGVTATAVAIAVASHVDDQRRDQCARSARQITAAMPGYALPLAVVGAVLVVTALGLAVVGRRGAGGGLRRAGTVLVAVAIIGTVFSLWLGVYAVGADIPIEPASCYFP